MGEQYATVYVRYLQNNMNETVFGATAVKIENSSKKHSLIDTVYL